MIVKLDLGDGELAVLRAQAEQQGLTLDELVQGLIRDHLHERVGRNEILASAERVRSAHEEALDRLAR